MPKLTKRDVDLMRRLTLRLEDAQHLADILRGTPSLSHDEQETHHRMSMGLARMRQDAHDRYQRSRADYWIQRGEVGS